MVLELARRQLANLAPVARRLNEATDVFTHELKSIEAELVALNLGLDVTLQDPLVPERDPEEDSNLPVEVHLGFGRLRNEWRIVVRETTDSEQVDAFGHRQRHTTVVRQTPLLDASRGIRIAAADQITRLLEAIILEARRKLAAIEKGVDAVPAYERSLSHEVQHDPGGRSTGPQ